jgi:hypothetical protein
MELKEFVKQTLCQIVEGVKEAQAAVTGHGGAVNPRFSRGAPSEFSSHGFMQTHTGGFAQFVQFDVALTATEGTGTKGGVGVVTGMFNLGSAGESKAENTSLSHVKFSVPLSLPNSGS